MNDYGDDDTPGALAVSSDVILDEMHTIIRSKLGLERWNVAKVDGWVRDIIDSSMKMLADLKKPFKFVITCVVMQKNGAGISTGFISLWDNTRDGMVNIPFENDSLHCLTTVYFVKVD